MKVTHIITTIDRGGAENAVASLVKAQVSHGYSVTVIPLKGKLELLNELQSSGANVETKLIGKHFLKQVRGLNEIIPFDSIVHSHLPRAELASRLSFSSHKLFVTRHNSEAFWPHGPRLISRLLSRFVLAKVKGAIFISEAVQTFLFDNKEIQSSAHSIVIHYGYEPRFSSKFRSAKKFNRVSEKCSLVTIGRLEPQKNIVLLLRMMNELKKLELDVQLSIIGEGKQRQSLEREVMRLGISNNVSFVGRLDNVYSRLQVADFFVLGSNYEGFGLVLLEAIDAGLPIIAPRNSSIPEVLGSDHPGLYDTDHLDQLVSRILHFQKNPDLISLTLSAQRVRLDLFNIDKYFLAHQVFYRSI